MGDINEASESSLVILDELGRGTSSEDGLQLLFSFRIYNTKIKCVHFLLHYKDLATI